MGRHAHASTNAVHGSLGETSVDHLLDLCRARLLTGKIEIRSDQGAGEIELRAGMIDAARLAGHADDVALERMRATDEGAYVVVQRLPDLGGSLGTAAEFHGDIEDLSLVAVMRHCEQNALTCTITVVDGFDRAELVYQAGEILCVTFNGVPDEERIVDIVRFDNAKFRVSAPPLDLNHGTPVMRRAPTEPFTVAHLRNVFHPVRDDEQLQPKPAAPEPAPKPPAPALSLLTRLRRRVARSVHALGDWLESDRFDTATERFRRAVRRS